MTHIHQWREYGLFDRDGSETMRICGSWVKVYVRLDPPPWRRFYRGYLCARCGERGYPLQTPSDATANEGDAA